MLSNFSKVLMAHISFTAVINNRGIGKGIGGIRKDTKNSNELPSVEVSIAVIILRGLALKICFYRIRTPSVSKNVVKSVALSIFP